VSDEKLSSNKCYHLVKENNKGQVANYITEFGKINSDKLLNVLQQKKVTYLPLEIIMSLFLFKV
jgi:hypothetical protein